MVEKMTALFFYQDWLALQVFVTQTFTRFIHQIMVEMVNELSMKLIYKYHQKSKVNQKVISSSITYIKPVSYTHLTLPTIYSV